MAGRAVEPTRAALLACGALQTALAGASEVRAGLCRRMGRLERAGMTEASPYWRDGKYLYLVHPTQDDGSRERKYIGADRRKIIEAEGRISRAKEHAELTKRLRHMDSSLDAVMSHLSAAASVLLALDRLKLADDVAAPRTAPATTRKK